MQTDDEPIVTKLFPSGGWEVVDYIGTERFRLRFFGVSKREAIRQFKVELKERMRDHGSR